MWDRPFLRRLFGFDHLIEVYKREPERVYGYYVLPLLARRPLRRARRPEGRPRPRRAADQALHAGAGRAPPPRRPARARRDAARPLARRSPRSSVPHRFRPMNETAVRAACWRTGLIHGHFGGTGVPALLLHGGPGFPDYMEPCAAELGSLFTTIRYTQRGVEPSDRRRPLHGRAAHGGRDRDPRPVRAGEGLGDRPLVGRPPRAPSRRRRTPSGCTASSASTRSRAIEASSPSSERSFARS